MDSRDPCELRPGISAVLMVGQDVDTAALDLAAVLEGLVAKNFEIIVVLDRAMSSDALTDLQARAPALPLRIVSGSSLAAGCNAARYDVLFVSAADGRFDVRELNHLLDAIERGADVAAGYRPHAADNVLRHLQRLGLNARLDCAFGLVRHRVWRELATRVNGQCDTLCADLLANVRRPGYVVAEVPVSGRRPTIGSPSRGAMSHSSHAA